MLDINIEVQKLLLSNKYYYSLKRKKIKQNYWDQKKDPDGNIRDRISNHEKEKKLFLQNNQNLIKIIKSLKFKSICDIGCGTGYILSQFSKKKKYLLGIDNDSHALQIASRYGEVKNVNLNKKTLSINSKFDLVTLYHVIEHIKKPEHLLKNINKILNKKGFLVLGTPDFDSAMARLYKNKYRMLNDQTHISLFSSDSLIRFLRDNKFKILKIDYPFFNTEYFSKKSLTKLLSRNKSSSKMTISPPFYGNFVTILAQKI